MTQQLGQLFLVPTPLDFGCDTQAPIRDSLPDATLQTALRLEHWVTENAKSTRAFIKRVIEATNSGESTEPVLSIQARQLVELPRQVHKKGDARAVQAGFDAKPLLAPALAGNDMGLVSEAGMPAIADPGSSLVRAAHELGIAVRPLVGPVSLLLALAASGLNGQNFAFVGYLPQDASERQSRLQELEHLAKKTGQTQLWIETPYRNAAMMQALVQSLQPSTRVLTATGLTLPSAKVLTLTAAQWKSHANAWPGDAPCVFGLGV
jgi:16S rRNA (cytidine1402-2'-O)-methyltransferase